MFWSSKEGQTICRNHNTVIGVQSRNDGWNRGQELEREEMVGKCLWKDPMESILFCISRFWLGSDSSHWSFFYSLVCFGSCFGFVCQEWPLFLPSLLWFWPQPVSYLLVSISVCHLWYFGHSFRPLLMQNCRKSSPFPSQLESASDRLSVSFAPRLPVTSLYLSNGSRMGKNCYLIPWSLYQVEGHRQCWKYQKSRNRTKETTLVEYQIQPDPIPSQLGLKLNVSYSDATR